MRRQVAPYIAEEEVEKDSYLHETPKPDPLPRHAARAIQLSQITIGAGFVVAAIRFLAPRHPVECAPDLLCTVATTAHSSLVISTLLLACATLGYWNAAAYAEGVPLAAALAPILNIFSAAALIVGLIMLKMAGTL